ncbi:MAG: hypothetical protein AB7D40_02810 [Bacteroidales bacterium]
MYVKSMRHYQDFVLNKLGVLKETHALPISDD